MKYYLIVGEASGDLHASNLMKALQRQDAQAEFRYYGGDKMHAVGGTLVRHYRDTAVMGVVRVLTHLRPILRNMAACKRDIANYQPDRVILVDYPGFNLSMAKYVKQQLHLPVFYYIPPKIWAWKEHRIHTIRRYVDQVLAIFPFEPEFYAARQAQAMYVGNPTTQSVREHRACSRAAFLQRNHLPDKRLVALLPGSRRQEVSLSMPLYVAVSQLPIFADCQFVLAATSAVPSELYLPYQDAIPTVYDQTYDLLACADVALVNSGTATLETALFGVPQVVCYPIQLPGWLYRWGRKHLLKIPYVSLVNIIAGTDVVVELLASDFTLEQVSQQLQGLLFDSEKRLVMQQAYRHIQTQLGPRVASDEAAQHIIAANW